MIEINNLTKRYPKSDTSALDDISFSVANGQFFALLGPNGAGKTTLLSILTTRLVKSHGHAKIANFDLDKKPGQIRQKIGVVFQQGSLDWHLTAEENVRFHTFLYGVFPFRLSYPQMPKPYRNRLSFLSDIFGLGNDLFQPIKKLSGGTRRKVEVVRSLITKPKILFLDEPTVGLDPHSRINLWQYLEQIRRQEGTTLFLTTHYLNEAESADRVGILDRGKLIALNHPKKIIRQLKTKNLESAYLEIINQSHE